jgi:serine/threonine protein kinase
MIPRSNMTISVPASVTGGETAAPPQLTPALIQSYLRSRGIQENVLVHSQGYEDFLREKGVTELGRGGEGAVYFLRGHVVKLVGTDFAPALLREIVHMLHLNPITSSGGDAAMGDRQRVDVPGLLWIYTLSNGGLSVGMKPFDLSDYGPRGSTLHDRLAVGPMLEREHMLRAILSIARTLIYTQKKGIVHHDLKPPNIYIPGDPQRDPVVFDLGQALWRQNVWGNNWLTHGHNLHYWYNGTYQYMHRIRRMAHLCALNIAGGISPSPREREAFQTFMPSLYDDVFAFAYIIRNIVRSRYTRLLEIDKRLLSDYYRSLMGLLRTKPRPKSSLARKSTIMDRMKIMFGKDAPAEPPPVITKPPAEPIGAETMEQAYAKLEPIVTRLKEIK